MTSLQTLKIQVKKYILILVIIALNTLSPTQAENTNNKNLTLAETPITKALYKPFIERYILDDLKLLRQEQQQLRVDFVEKVANARLDISDRALKYTADTTTNIFYIITIAATLLVLLGWRSLQDIRDNIKTITSKQISDLTKKYEKRLSEIEDKARVRSEQIISTQQDIANTNLIHSLWVRSGITKSEQEKINIFDEILDITPDDIEALTYKADTLLDIDEDTWSLSLSNRAIEIDDKYALAYWQRACAKAKLGQHDDAVADIKLAIDLTDSLKTEVMNEIYFENLKNNKKFQVLIGKIGNIENN
ncbi:MAG: TPR repeat containing protein [Candidatus Ruthia sp. Asou_11_S2]|nr:TPR repeat containing protein [Candidatus Ruthia sp. Asou_11_S2]